MNGQPGHPERGIIVIHESPLQLFSISFYLFSVDLSIFVVPATFALIALWSCATDAESIVVGEPFEEVGVVEILNQNQELKFLISISLQNDL